LTCLTLSLADTLGIAKYAHTYIRRYTHTHTLTHTHTHTHTHTRKRRIIGKNQKRKGGKELKSWGV